jgi:hypothetical protein
MGRSCRSAQGGERPFAAGADKLLQRPKKNGPSSNVDVRSASFAAAQDGNSVNPMVFYIGSCLGHSETNRSAQKCCQGRRR